jgi:hypothetical protein
MLRQITNSSLDRSFVTPEPRFKRLAQLASLERDSSCSTLKQSVVARPTTFDNSKENLYYENRLVKVRSACKLDETIIVSKYLGAIRKDFDEMAKGTAREMATLNMRRKDIEFFKSRNKAMEQQRLHVEMLISKHEADVSAVREKFEDAGMQTKSLENIILRMKKDEIFYKQFGRLKGEELHRKTKECKLLD